ncbi:MAG: ribonuclease P protein component [Capsulimonas sp.]|jgi:ribonuclease P protein component|uniref:ribonuclease P protein component n=1 Tax=Capsulimonas sp. TaxID=2494211 RepID=UPI003266E121|nr:rnpA [Capsulimonas sp.]
MLPRYARLKRNRDFRAVYARRRLFHGGVLMLYVRPRTAAERSQGLTAPRFGFVISKKVSKRANIRNRIKRRLREICRLHVLSKMRADAAVDVMFVARTSATDANFSRLMADVETLGRQAGLF